MNIYVTAKIHNELQYLHNLFPIIWSPFISGAFKFSSIDEARMAMNCIYKNMFEYEDFTVDSLYSMEFIGITNGTVVIKTPYVTKEV